MTVTNTVNIHTTIDIGGTKALLLSRLIDHLSSLARLRLTTVTAPILFVSPLIKEKPRTEEKAGGKQAEQRAGEMRLLVGRVS